MSYYIIVYNNLEPNSSWVFEVMFKVIVKLVYHDHPREPKFVAVDDRR